MNEPIGTKRIAWAAVLATAVLLGITPPAAADAPDDEPSWLEVPTHDARGAEVAELREAWRKAGKPVFAEPKAGPHGVVGPWRGRMLMTRVDFELLFVDGHDVQGDNTVTVPPGRREFTIRWDAAKDEVQVFSIDVEDGMEYRLFPRLRKGARTPRAGWHVVVRARPLSARD